MDKTGNGEAGERKEEAKIMVLNRTLKKRTKLWKKLGFEYEEVLGLFTRLHILEQLIKSVKEILEKDIDTNKKDIDVLKGVIPNMEKSLNEAIKICNKQTEEVKKENEKRKEMYKYLTEQETVKEG